VRLPEAPAPIGQEAQPAADRCACKAAEAIMMRGAGSGPRPVAPANFCSQNKGPSCPILALCVYFNLISGRLKPL
jgi:hypothetical protein